MQNESSRSLETIAVAVNSGDEARNQERLTETAVEECKNAILQNDEITSSFVFQLFPGGLPDSDTFYNKLYRLAIAIGFDRKATPEFVGHIWSHVLLSLQEHERESLLRDFSSARDLFIVLRSLSQVIKTVPFCPSFLVNFFLALRARVERDGMQGPFWRAIEVWGETFPDAAHQGLEHLLQLELDDGTITIGASILGSLRVQWEKQPSREKIDLPQLAEDLDVKKRIVYHHSWINTGWLRGLTHSELCKCLERMSRGGNEELAEAFNFLRCIIPDPKTTQESIDHSLQWLRTAVTPSLSEVSQGFVVRIVDALSARWIVENDKLQSVRELLELLQPLHFENEAAWSQIEQILVRLLHQNLPQFEVWLTALLNTNPTALTKHFRENGSFEYLCSEMVTHKTSILQKLLFSVEDHRRQFAFVAFNAVPFDTFCDGLLRSVSDNEIALCLFEARRHFFEAENTARFLLALRERAEGGGEPLGRLYRDELVYQAKNFPGAVLKRLEQLAGTSILLEEVTAEANRYFAKLRLAHGSAINSMEIPGLRRAQLIRSRRQSRTMESHSNKFNVFAQFVSTSYLIYGTKGFQYSRDGNLGEVSEMRKMSVTMEMPRLAMIDPEGAAMREVGAGRLTDDLAKLIVAQKERDE